MKVYSLVGKKLIESTPEELMESKIGMIVDEHDEMIRLIITPDARKKQRELLVQESAEFNKNEFAGTYLVSHLENPVLIKSVLEEVRKIQSGEIIPETAKPKEEKPKEKKKGKKKKEEQDEVIEEESNILQRWDPELVKKAVVFLDGKNFVPLSEIQEKMEVTEGEAYWLTQDLIHVGIVPGRWTGFPDGQWVYQVLTEQPLDKTSTEKPKTTKSKNKK
ncbi:MAG: hypothetical protein ACFFDW_13070 [Candidatus Thorarchaeota archaeon]